MDLYTVHSTLDAMPLLDAYSNYRMGPSALAGPIGLLCDGCQRRSIVRPFVDRPVVMSGKLQKNGFFHVTFAYLIYW